MKKGTYKLLAALWILALIATRIVYFLYGNRTVVDTYEYYAYARIQADQVTPVLTSGMAYAYVGNLSGLLAFLGNRMELLGIYQLLLQMVWMILLFLGVGLIFGKIAQMLTGTILALSPWILETIFVISPENYFMLFFSLLILGLGVIYAGVKENGRQGNFFLGTMLLLVSFGIGIICIWNYLGWLLIPVVLYVLLKSRVHWSKLVVFLMGVALGNFLTLLKYTAVTGLSISEQFSWWLEPLKALPRRCQDLSIQMTIWLVFAGVMGVLIAVIADHIRQRKLHSLSDGQMQDSQKEGILVEEEASVEEVTAEEPVEEKPVTYTVTADGRKVALLDNPLPLPKKHEKRKMDFKYNELPMDVPETLKEWKDHGIDGQAFDDFDITIAENDDFDV